MRGNVRSLTLLTCFIMMSILVSLLGPADSGCAEFKVERALKEITLSGYTRSVRSLPLSSEVTGRVVKINYDVGDIITTSARNEKNSAKSGFLSFAELDTAFVDFDIKGTEISISRTENQLKQIDSRTAYLRREFRRIEELFSKGRTTEVIRDAAAQDLDQAVLERAIVKNGLDSLKVTLEQLSEKKRRHTVPAPEFWIVTDRKIEVGEMVQSGNPVGVVQDFRQLVVPLVLSADELEALIQKGAVFDAFLEGREVKASIDYINPGFNEKTRKSDISVLIIDDRNIDDRNREKVKKSAEQGIIGPADTGGNSAENEMRRDNSNFEHRGGLRFSLPLSISTNGMRIPAAALSDRYANPKVFIKGSIEPVDVTILERSESYITVAERPGLMPGTLLDSPPSSESGDASAEDRKKNEDQRK